VPIKSYLAYPVTGRRDALARALAALGGCEVIPASNRDVLVLVTDTPHEDAERALQATVGELPDSLGLTLVSGVDDPEAVGAPAVTMPHEEPRHHSP
jgi:hypothetical protein